MSQSHDEDNTYQLDPEHESELTRLILQSRFMTRAQGGLFTEEVIQPQSRVIDLACGPGDWALDLAIAYREQGVEVVGIDISTLMTEYAQAQATALGAQNATFLTGTILKPLPFPSDSFDIINARFLSFMPQSAWHPLLQECYRLLKPSGIIRLTEAEAAISNSPAYEKMTLLVVQALNKAGQGFSANGHVLGVTAMLRFFLERNGFNRVQERATVVNYSSGQPAHEFQYQNYVIGAPLILPYLLKHEVTTREEFEQITEHMQREMREHSFCSVSFLVTAWGRKPEETV